MTSPEGLLNGTSGRILHVGGSNLTLRDIAPSDRRAVLDLHTLVFGPDVDERWFTWKYGQAPNQGQGQAVGVWCGGDLIAYCGGLPRTLWTNNSGLRALQIGDVMVHPAWRGILTRRGPFYHVSKGFYDSRLGAPPIHRFRLGYGFPSERHLRLAVLLGLLRDAGAIESLHWKTSSMPALHLPWYWHWEALQPTDPSFDRDVNTAWMSMRKHAGSLTLGQRDADYFRWRYVERPASAGTEPGAPPRYHFFAVRRLWSRTASGVAVIDLRTDPAHWLDWVGPVHMMPLVSSACRMEAALAGASELMAWTSVTVGQKLTHTGIHRREVCSGLGIPTSSDLSPQEIPGLRWWLMGGDTDFL